MSDSRLLRKYRGEHCLNCQHPLDTSDKYCPQCGQLNTSKKLAVSDVFNEFLASIISYDSRLRNTLFALLFRPGKITKDYVNGRRQHYVNPFRFYLSVSIIFFIVFSFTLDLDGVDNTNFGFDDSKAVEFNRGKDKGNGVPINFSINENEVRDTVTNYQDIYYTEAAFKEMGFYNNFKKRTSLYNKFYLQTDITNVVRGLDSLKHEKSFYNKFLYKKTVQFEDITDNPSSIFNYFLNQLPFIIFFFLPIFALFIKLLYLRRKFSYMEHLIFLFHVQSLFFVLYIIPTILLFFDIDVGGVFILIFLFYLYKAMRKFYQQGRFKTIVKFLIVNMAFSVLAFIGMVLAFLVSFATY